MKVTVNQDQVSRLYDDIRQEWVKEAMTVLPREMNHAAPIGPTRQDRPDRGGLLGKSHKASPRGSTREPRVEVTAGTPYSFITHEGRGPVVPRQAPILRWFENWDEEFVAQRVGPAEGQPWMVEVFRALGFTQVRHVKGKVLR